MTANSNSWRYCSGETGTPFSIVLNLTVPVPEGTTRSVISVTTSAFSALRVIDVLDALEFLEFAVVAMLIFDGSHDQRVNLLGTGRGISSDDGALAAGQRPRVRSAGPRRHSDQTHSQRHNISSMKHAFPWRCRV